MKLLIILFLTLALYAEPKHEVLIPLASYHSDKTIEGYEVNEFNYGIGYRYADTKSNGETSVSSMILKDTYGHPMLTTTVGASLYLLKNDISNIRIGVEAGIGYRKLLYMVFDSQGRTDTFKYKFIPLIAPVISFQYEKFGMNFTYTPEITNDTLKIHEVVFLYLSYQI